MIATIGHAVARSFAWGLARSKNSMTHLWANVVIAASLAWESVSALIEHGVDLFAWLDPEMNQQIVAVIGADAPAYVAHASLALMIVTKAARDRAAPFTKADPHA